MATLIPSCVMFNASNLKKLANGLMYINSAVIKIVILMISKTKLFLYFKVVNIE